MRSGCSRREGMTKAPRLHLGDGAFVAQIRRPITGTYGLWGQTVNAAWLTIAAIDVCPSVDG